MRVHLPGALLARLRQRFQGTIAIQTVLAYRLPPVAPVHQVINRSGYTMRNLRTCSEVGSGQEDVNIVDPFLPPFRSSLLPAPLLGAV